MLIALAPTGPPQTYKRVVSKTSINSVLQRRVSCLKYLKNAHLGKEPWLDTARIPRTKWNSIYQPELTRSYYALGANLGALSTNEYSDLRQFLNAIQTVLHYFDYHDHKRISATRLKLTKAKSSKNNNNTHNTGHKPLSPTPSETSFGSQPTEHSTGLPPPSPPHTTSSSHFRAFSLKGRKLFGKKKEADSHQDDKAVASKKSAHFSGLFSHSKDHPSTDQNMLSPISSLTSSSVVVPAPTTASNVAMTSTGTVPSLASTTSTGRTRSGSGLFTYHTNTSIHSGSSGGSNSTALTSASTLNSGSVVSNANNSINGTGTYTMGKKQVFHSNIRADHSSVNQNQLSSPIVPSSMAKTLMLQAVLDNLIVVNEHDLPFIPDALESIITLLDLLINIYRSISHTLDSYSDAQLSRAELSELDVALAAVEVIIRRTIITDGLVAIDAEYLSRRVPRSKDLLEKDIIRFCSQPNANVAKQKLMQQSKKQDQVNYLGKIVSDPPITVMPQSQAAYV